ncbi:cytochrome C oxidase subunit IV family protein [Sphingobacterium corticis]|uniref:Cytochrome C oxidase subunit IV family protein n=1 Tax=Sphingobacterium corticis TaxID=1812823 RepID=A0ABW5NIX3_9SPHI
MAHHDHTAGAHEEHHEGMGAKQIWSVFFVLLALTALEFLIALGFVHHWQILAKGMFVNIIYILLTLVKAYYIVAFFMHLKFEKSSFIVCSTIVFIFIAYFIVLMLTEGSYLGGALQDHAIYPNK